MKHTILTSIILIMSIIIHAQKTNKTMEELVTGYEFKTKTQTIDSVHIAYIKEGTGDKTLLFIHGLSSNLDAWYKNIKELKKHYTCVAVDLPGYGKSSKPNVSYTPTYFAEIIKKFITVQKLKNIIVVGHSMGGQASIKLAVLHPTLLKKVILIAPAGLEKFSETHAVFMKNTFTTTLVKNTTDAQIEKNYALNFYKKPKGVEKMIHQRKLIKKASNFNAHCNAIVKSIAGMLDDPVSEDLKHIEHKTLVIFGENDMLIPNKYFHPNLTVKKVGNIATENIKNSNVIYVKESGHFLQFEKPAQVNTIIKKFIDQK